MKRAHASRKIVININRMRSSVHKAITTNCRKEVVHAFELHGATDNRDTQARNSWKPGIATNNEGVASFIAPGHSSHTARITIIILIIPIHFVYRCLSRHPRTLYMIRKQRNSTTNSQGIKSVRQLKWQWAGKRASMGGWIEELLLPQIQTSHQEMTGQ